jgi:GxxExxY protein
MCVVSPSPQQRPSPMTLELVLAHANKIMKDLGSGHREGIYAKALVVSLNQAGVPHRHEVDIPIMYLGQCVGHGRADLIVDDMIIEIKAVFRPPKEAVGQIQKYVTNLSKVERHPFTGIILNFCQATGVVSAYTFHEPVAARKTAQNTVATVTKSRFFQGKQPATRGVRKSPRR